MKKRVLSTLLLAALAPPLAAAPGEPRGEGGKPAARQQGGGGHGGHAHPWSLMEMEGAEVRLWTSDLRTLAVPYDGHWAHLPKSGVDNYHAAVAVEEGEALTKTVIHYSYRNGRPSGHSPSELLALEKAPLEIVPDPLPREHYRYLTGERWGFIVRLFGEPVADAEVELHTIHGSLQAARTDADGRVGFALPDDFPRVNAGRRANPQRPFIVRTELARDGHRYRTTLQAEYRPSPSHWRSLEWGVATAGVGFAAGLIITGVGRRRKEGAK